MTRQAGILCPLFAVPANQGIGDLGQKTLRMIDEIAAGGYKIWQILPLQMTGMSHSPYQTLTSFAGDPIYINIDRLAEMGLLTQSSVVNCNKFKDKVSYDAVRTFKETYFKRAFRAFKKQYATFRDEFEQFCEDAFWLDDWTTYCLFKGMYDLRAWPEWEEEYRDWPLDPSNIDLSEFEDEKLYHAFLQWLFDRQMREVVAYAKEKGVQLMGDLPFYPAHDSADVWVNRHLFGVDSMGHLAFVGGCPPDSEHPEGQVWNHPVYNFINQKKDGFKYWRSRLKWMARYFDMVRIDHFRGIDTYWRIPAGQEARQGRWILGPRNLLLDALQEECPDVKLVAEDLGQMRPEVGKLCEEYDIPGMDVLQYRMDTKSLKAGNKPHAILYPSTHDTATTEEEYQSYDQNKRIGLRRYFKKAGYNMRAFHDIVNKYVIDSDAETVILPIQDICGYKGAARINVSGSDSPENWTWKLKDFKTFPAEIQKTKPWLEEAGRL